MTLVAVSRLGGTEELSTEALRGLVERRPVEALLITTSLLGVAGFPLTLGFTGKLLVMEPLARPEAPWPFLVATTLIVLGAFPSLRVVLHVLSQGDVPAAPAPGAQRDRWAGAVLLVALGVTLWAGFAPETLVSMARRAALGLF